MSKPKPWIERATALLEQSLVSLPTEPNELDWKSGLSPNKDRLVEHLSAFANHADGGFMAFGIDNVTGRVTGVEQSTVEKIVGQLTNLGRDALEPPIVIDHAIVEREAVSLLLIRIPERAIKPVHRRGKSIEHAWVRSGGTTRRASRQEIGAMLMNSRTPSWEELRGSERLSTSEALSALDVAAVCKLLQRPVPVDANETLRWLIDERMVEPDNDGAYITHFGAIGAARDLRRFDALQRKRIRVIRYRGLNKVETIDDSTHHHLPKLQNRDLAHRVVGSAVARGLCRGVRAAAWPGRRALRDQRPHSHTRMVKLGKRGLVREIGTSARGPKRRCFRARQRP